MLVSGDDSFRILSSEKKPLGCVAQIMVLAGQVLGQTGDLRWRQSMSKRTKQALLCRVLIKVEAVKQRKDEPGEFYVRKRPFDDCYESHQCPAAKMSSSNSTIESTEAWRRFMFSCTASGVNLKILHKRRAKEKETKS